MSMRIAFPKQMRKCYKYFCCCCCRFFSLCLENVCLHDIFIWRLNMSFVLFSVFYFLLLHKLCVNFKQILWREKKKCFFLMEFFFFFLPHVAKILSFQLQFHFYATKSVGLSASLSLFHSLWNHHGICSSIKESFWPWFSNQKKKEKKKQAEKIKSFYCSMLVVFVSLVLIVLVVVAIVVSLC